jgi:hypothetical protein
MVQNDEKALNLLSLQLPCYSQFRLWGGPEEGVTCVDRLRGIGCEVEELFVAHHLLLPGLPAEGSGRFGRPIT